jgi:hypothetical protein
VTTHDDDLRRYLAQGPTSPRQLLEKTGISQPTLSRAITAMGDAVVRIGAARSIQYVLRDAQRGLNDIPVYRVGTDGTIQPLGELIPVRPDGFVMRQADGITLHSDSLPWWLLDMRPQGFLGRAYAAQHADMLGLPTKLSDWSDADALRALMAHGHDAVGNVLLGDRARDHFLSAPPPAAIPTRQKGAIYARLAQEATSGDRPGSSAGGEQPKFTALVQTPTNPCHVLVKFTLPEANPVTERWRDLLLAEHHALETLRAAGLPAARSGVIDHAGQRFLELERFDRVGTQGRCGLCSLSALEAEFVGDATAPWPALAARLAAGRHIRPAAVHDAARLYAFGTLIGNTDMHNGNLSFVSHHGRPYALAPAYDMLPMAFAPRASGGMPHDVPTAHLHASVPHPIWGQTLGWASDFLDRLRADSRCSANFQPCLQSLARHLDVASTTIARLG